MENIKILMACLTILVAVPVVSVSLTAMGLKKIWRTVSNKTIKISIETRVKDSEA